MRIGSRWRGVGFAIALAAIGGASTCSNEPTAPLTLDGTFTIVTVDGHRPPAPFDSAIPSLPWPHAMITGGTAEFVAPDTIWLTTRLNYVDSLGHVVSTPQAIPVFYLYIRTGDSLYNAIFPGPLGAVTGSVLHLHIDYPTPPTNGYIRNDHYYTLTK